MSKKTIIATDKDHLQSLIKDEIDLHGFQCNLNSIDVINVKDMEGLFRESEFNGDISQWNVGNVTKMANMLHTSKFTGDLTIWKPYSLEHDMDMFKDCPAPVPYWHGVADTKKAINNYHLNEKLKVDLIGKHNSSPKTKI